MIQLLGPTCADSPASAEPRQGTLRRLGLAFTAHRSLAQDRNALTLLTSSDKLLTTTVGL
jgi:hypothetical protein